MVLAEYLSQYIHATCVTVYCTIIFSKMYTYMHVPECVERLLAVIIRRTYIGDHDGLSVAPQRVLEEPSQLGVTVGNVSAPSRH